MNKHEQVSGSATIVVGLPGSGKTTYLKQLLSDGEIDNFYDDYQKGAPEKDKSNPRSSPNYTSLKADLEHGRRVAISDIRYCDIGELAQLMKLFKDDFPGVDVRRVFFANDSAACKHNVRRRGRDGRVELEIQFIDEHSPEYSPPQGEAMPVIMG